MENSLFDFENEQIGQKRKFNVVIQEEELELVVLEVGSFEVVKLKCILEERQQFMKVFRQLVLDVFKNGVKKFFDKQKEFNEKFLNEDGRDSNFKKVMRNFSVEMVLNNVSLQLYIDKGSFFKEKSKKLRKKGKKMLDIGVILGENREGNI